MTQTDMPTSRPLVFYVGTIPFFSLLYIVAHLAALQFNGVPSAPYRARWSSRLSKLNGHQYNADYTSTTTFLLLCVAVLHTLLWLAQATLCTSCELAPILHHHEGYVPTWCPQSRFHETGQPGLAKTLGTLATVKDFLQWIMVILAFALIECARQEYKRAEKVRGQMLRTVDFRKPSQGVDLDNPSKTLTTAQLNAISGPQLVYRAEEDARRKQEEEDEKRRQEEAKTRKNLSAGIGTLPSQPQPVGPGVPGNKDNYYGNGTVLKRSGNLNHMYESRVAEHRNPPSSRPEPTPAQKQPLPSEIAPTGPAASGSKDNYYGNGTILQRSGTVSYESRVAEPMAPAPLFSGTATRSTSRPRRIALPPLPEVSVASGHQDNNYGGEMGLTRSGTVDYESRI